MSAARWAGGTVVSLGLHAAAAGALALALQPREMPQQPVPETQLDLAAYAVERTEAIEAQPDSEAAAAGEADGTQIGSDDIPRADARPLAAPTEGLSATVPDAARAEAAQAIGETLRPDTPMGDVQAAAIPDAARARPAVAPADAALAAVPETQSAVGQPVASEAAVAAAPQAEAVAAVAQPVAELAAAVPAPEAVRPAAPETARVDAAPVAAQVAAAVAAEPERAQDKVPTTLAALPGAVETARAETSEISPEAAPTRPVLGAQALPQAPVSAVAAALPPPEPSAAVSPPAPVLVAAAAPPPVLAVPAALPEAARVSEAVAPAAAVAAVAAPVAVVAAVARAEAAPAAAVIPAAFAAPPAEAAASAVASVAPEAAPATSAATEGTPAAAVPPPAEDTPPGDPGARASAAADLPPPSDFAKAAVAWAGENGAVDPQSLAAIQEFMQPGDLGAASAGTVRDGIAGFLSNVPCARLQAAFVPETGALELRGHIPEEGLRGPVLAALQAQVGGSIPVQDNMLILPRPQCGALAGIANVGLPQSTEALNNPLIVGPDAHAVVYGYVEEDDFAFTMQAPEYDAYVYVDYFMADGNVLHLLPNEYLALSKRPADTVVEIGQDPCTDYPFCIKVAPPFGQEIAAAFASSVPLYDGLRPILEPVEPYLAFLTERVAAARAANPDFKGEWVYFFIQTSAR